MADERTKPTSDNQRERRAALAISTPGRQSGTHGMNAEQASVVHAAGQKFKTSWFTIGMFCEHADVEASDCVEVFAELVDIGAIRKPVNDGGCCYYQVVPELAMRAIMSQQMPQI